jgi:glycosyltransferase involved in cell wall biosynthesis
MNLKLGINRISVIGIVGVPGMYGGFETLAENLIKYWHSNQTPCVLSVYCSSRHKKFLPREYFGAFLRYLPINANGIQSILYDCCAILHSSLKRDKTILILGVSGAVIIPIVRIISSSRIITNIDGIEWRREKWKGFARAFLRFSERLAVKYSHVVVTDNQAIDDYVRETYGVSSVMIPYGGDHALASDPNLSAADQLPDGYALALCRIEPENNVSMILEAFARIDRHLVFIGNWNKSHYGRSLKAKYGCVSNFTLLDPIYDPRSLRAIRNRAVMYIHGHSAGGTNPSLVEMMHFSIPIFAHACIFNRLTTEGMARYFLNAKELADAIQTLSQLEAEIVGASMGEIARRRYTWDQIGSSYFHVLSASA